MPTGAGAVVMGRAIPTFLVDLWARIGEAVVNTNPAITADAMIRLMMVLLQKKAGGLANVKDGLLPARVIKPYSVVIYKQF